jgi:hypothetical protein
VFGLEAAGRPDPYGSVKGVIEDFAKAYPGITPELTTMASGSLMVPQVLQEHKAGIYPFERPCASISTTTSCGGSSWTRNRYSAATPG